MTSSRENDERLQAALDRIIKQVASRNPTDGFQVDEQDLLDYLEGKADESLAETIRAAVADSAELRLDLVEIGRDLDRLKEVADTAVVVDESTRPATDRSTFLGEETPSPWPARKPPAPDNPWQDFLDFLRSLLLKPAVAYALTFALMAYPTYRFFVPGEPVAPLVSDSRLVYLDAGDITVRGEDQPGVSIVMAEGDNSVLTLGLYAANPFTRGQRYRLEIINNDRPVWEEERSLKAWDPLEPSRIDIQLNTRGLEPGRIVIRIQPLEEDGSVIRQEEAFLFDLERQ